MRCFRRPQPRQMRLLSPGPLASRMASTPRPTKSLAIASPSSRAPPDVRRTSTTTLAAPLLVRSPTSFFTWSAVLGPTAAIRSVSDTRSHDLSVDVGRPKGFARQFNDVRICGIASNDGEAHFAAWCSAQRPQSFPDRHLARRNVVDGTDVVARDEVPPWRLASCRAATTRR